MDTVILYCRAFPAYMGGGWACTTVDGDTIHPRHLGLFGAALARRALGLDVGTPIEFRLL